MCDHDHSHCDHSHDGEDASARFSLYLKIDVECLQCLNEQEENSGKTVFKPWDERFNQEKYVESDVDEELLFNIPFHGVVKLKSVAVIGGENTSHPTEMRLFKNIVNMTFDDTSRPPEQAFTFPRPQNELDILQYPTKTPKFANVNHLSIHFPHNFGCETTKIYYIGLAGEFLQEQRQSLVVTNYELCANPADHKNKLFDASSHMIS